MKRKVPKSEAGFTLLELMIASGILAVALSMVFGSLISVNVMGRLAESRTEATVAISSVVEDIRGTSIDDLLSYEAPDFSGIGIGNMIIVRCTTGDGTELVLPYTGETEQELPNPVTLQVQLIWAEDEGRAYTKEVTVIREGQ